MTKNKLLLSNNRKITYFHKPADKKTDVDKYKPILFIPGLFMKSTIDHKKLIESLYPEVVGLDLWDFNNQPHSVVGFADVLEEIVYNIEKKAFTNSDFNKGYDVFGFSFGATAGINLAYRDNNVKHMAGVNPVTPTDYGLIGYLLRINDIWKSESSGASAGKESQNYSRKVFPQFWMNVFRYLPRTWSLVKEIDNYEYQNIEKKVDDETKYLLFFAGKDQFFPYSKKVDELFTKKIPNLEKVVLKDSYHDRLLFYEQEFVKPILEYFKS